MNRIITNLIFLLSIISLSSYAQIDSLYVNYEPTQGLIFTYPIQSGQTIFGLSHVFGSNVEETIDLNKGKDLEILSLNEYVRFKLNSEIISNDKNNRQNLPIMYKVKPKETLYTIARIYANKNVKTIMELNNKQNYNLSLGELIVLGYIEGPFFEKESVPADEKIIENENMLYRPITIMNATHSMPNSIDSIQMMSAEDIAPSIKREKGLAMWEATQYGNTELLVMHPTARINSNISIYNPMLKTTVKAKVVGALPKNSYPSNISVVISPGVASALGALDKRFLVELTYIE